jgi:diguanylate cyclase (GGDEF)-like protein
MGTVVVTCVLTLSVLLSAVIAVVAWRQRATSPVVRPLTALAIGIAVWSVADCVGEFNNRPGTRALLAMVIAGFAGVFLVTSGFFCLSKAIVDRSWRLSGRTALLLVIEPAVSLLLIATNHWQHLFVADHLTPGPAGSFSLRFGPAFWAHALYSYSLVVIGFVRVGRAWWRAPRQQRRVYGWVMSGSVPPLAVNVLGLLLPGRVDLTAVGFAVSVAIIYRAAIHRPVVNLVPVARQLVLDVISDGIVVLDRQGRVIDLNPAAQRMLQTIVPDLPASALGTQLGTWLGLDLTSPEDVEIEQTFDNANNTGIDLNIRLNPLRDQRNGALGWALVARDVTDLQQQRRELVDRLRTIELLRADLSEQASRDALTGLHNRRHLMEALPGDLARATREHQPVSVAVLDIDYFKKINDRYGHGVGDEVLVHVGGMLGDALRAGDTLARYGGEEFVVVLPGASLEQARDRLDTLRERIQGTPVQAGEHLVPVTFSAGVACFSGSESEHDLLHAADTALYAAKNAGRNRVLVTAAPLSGSRLSATS